MQEQVYPYKQKLWLGPVVMAFFGLAAYFFWQKLQASQRGLLINDVIELSPHEALYFYWALFGVSIAFVGMGLCVTLLAFRGPRQVMLSPTALLAPQGAVSARYIEIPYSLIETLRVQEIHGQRFLHISHAGGKLSLVQSLLPSRQVFDELCTALAVRVRRAG